MLDRLGAQPCADVLKHGVARVPLANTGNGTHTTSSPMAFGVTVYGYGSYTSYWHPGGLDLHIIPVP